MILLHLSNIRSKIFEIGLLASIIFVLLQSSKKKYKSDNGVYDAYYKSISKIAVVHDIKKGVAFFYCRVVFIDSFHKRRTNAPLAICIIMHLCNFYN